MTVEQLLKPRYKVVDDYPFSYYDKDSVLLFEFYHAKDGIVNFCEYPHLFRKLEWWEERKVEDMPEYLKFCDDRNSTMSIGDDEEPEVHKVKRQWATSLDTHWRYGNKDCFISEWHNTQYSYGAFEPATKQEYNAQCQTQ